MVDESELLTVENAAQTLGVAPDKVQALILAGSLPYRLVPGEGGTLEVRVERSSLAGLPSGAPTRSSAGEVGGQEQGVPDPEPPAASAEGYSLTVPQEVRALASGLADELFQRWQLAMETQFRQELAVRLQSELAHRERVIDDLREEVQEREEERFGPGGRRVRGMTDLYATWERRRTLIRQSRELAETERQMSELRARLRELGVEDDDEGSTVDVHPASPPAADGNPPEHSPRG